MKLRPGHIWTYGKINFVHTVLSKRKLNWFVEQKIVDGWFDPRYYQCACDPLPLLVV